MKSNFNTLAAALCAAVCISSANAADPSAPAATPTRLPADVISLYTSSGTYASVPIDTWLTAWSMATEADYPIPATSSVVKKYSGLNYAGVEFLSTPINASGMTTFHVDLWTPDATKFSVKLVSDVGLGSQAEHEVVFTSSTITQDNWVSLDIPLSQFTGVNLANLGQLLWIDNNPAPAELGTFYIDNVYFYKTSTPPSTNGVHSSIRAGTDVSWTASGANSYQPQKSGNNSVWTDLGPLISGNSITSLFDPVKSPFYRVLEIIPAGGGSGGVVNGGFETAGTSPTNAASWTVNQAAGSPKLWFGRTNNTPNSGTSSFEIHLEANLGQGPVVSLQQTGVPVTGGATLPFTFYANLLAGSAGAVPQWRIMWDVGGETGFHNYTPGNNTYALINNSVSVPAGATSATVIFYTPGAADTTQSATLLLDDVALGSGGGGSPGSTNILTATVQPGVQISWPSSNGINYQVQSATSLSLTPAWSNNGGLVAGNGNINVVSDSLANSNKFYQVLPAP